MKRTDITALFPDATEEQVNKIMNLNGDDINKAKGELETLKGQLSTAQTELANLKAKPGDDIASKLAAAEKELAGLKASNALRDLREKVSKETGVPSDLLTAETEEACKAQADAIKAYAKPSYPPLPDGGEVHGAGSSATRDKFADWFNETMK